MTQVHLPARRRRIVARAVALLAVALLAHAPGAHAVELGISDSNAGTVVAPSWDGLGIRHARVVVPYDLATTVGAAGAARRDAFERYREYARAKNVELLVVFAASQDVRAPASGDAVAPSADAYAAGFAAFRQRYPEITTFAAWNEPNNVDARQYPLASDPRLAAAYWLRATAMCPECTIAAGDFAGIPGDDAYIDAYQAALGEARPAVWAFHAHSDVNAFQAGGPDSARIARYYLSRLQGRWAGARVWIDEIGARYRDPAGVVWGDASQQQATRFLLGLATLDPRIERIYYYNYANECVLPRRCAIQDRGLVAPAPLNGQPPTYDAPGRRRAAYDVIAARGPVIPPADPVPPAVTIEQPAQSSAVRTPTPTFAGRAAVGGRAAAEVTVQIFAGLSATEGTVPVQTATGAATDGRWSAAIAGPLADGVYTARAAQAGNPRDAGVSEEVVFTVDTVAPTSVIAAAPPAQTGARTATFRIEASEPGARFECRLDRGRLAPCEAAMRFERLALGRHELAVRAVDQAGNAQARPTRHRWRVVALATALAPRLAGLGAGVAGGLPVAVACADACRAGARLYAPRASADAAGLAHRPVSDRDPARPRGGGYVTVARAAVARPRAGTATLTLRLRPRSAAALAATDHLTLRLGLLARGRRSPGVTLSRRVALARRGALAALTAGGMPLTAACTSACAQRATLWVGGATARALGIRGRPIAGGGDSGLPRGARYVQVGTRTLRRARGGVVDLTLRPTRAARARLVRPPTLALRVAGRGRGPGAAALAGSFPLVLAR